MKNNVKAAFTDGGLQLALSKTNGHGDTEYNV